MSVADEIFAVFDRRGSDAYFGESISMTQHALQAAYFARRDAAPPALVVAALLHDLGHLVEFVSDDLADWKDDAHHEEVGARWLASRLRTEIAEPIRLHVPAKRYLCATDDTYVAMLSQASVATLKLQGGPMSQAEVLQFETDPYCKNAVSVRRWDDRGKVAGLRAPGLNEYRHLIEEFTLGA
jgi:phosphonate degradation associated HDIG domain protein